MAERSVSGLRLRGFYAAFPEALVILLARVFHHFPVGPQRERPRVGPRLRERLRILDAYFPVDVAEIGPREALHEMELIAVRVADGVETRPAVEVDGVDDQRVAFPVADRIAEPRGDAVAVLTAVDGDDVEPGILLEQKREVLVALHDLHRLRRVDGAAHAEG